MLFLKYVFLFSLSSFPFAQGMEMKKNSPKKEGPVNFFDGCKCLPPESLCDPQKTVVSHMWSQYTSNGKYQENICLINTKPKKLVMQRVRKNEKNEDGVFDRPEKPKIIYSFFSGGGRFGEISKSKKNSLRLGAFDDYIHGKRAISIFDIRCQKKLLEFFPLKDQQGSVIGVRWLIEPFLAIATRENFSNKISIYNAVRDRNEPIFSKQLTNNQFNGNFISIDSWCQEQDCFIVSEHDSGKVELYDKREHSGEPVSKINLGSFYPRGGGWNYQYRSACSGQTLQNGNLFCLNCGGDNNLPTINKVDFRNTKNLLPSGKIDYKKDDGRGVIIRSVVGSERPDSFAAMGLWSIGDSSEASCANMNNDVIFGSNIGGQKEIFFFNGSYGAIYINGNILNVI